MRMLAARRSLRCRCPRQVLQAEGCAYGPHELPRPDHGATTTVERLMCLLDRRSGTCCSRPCLGGKGLKSGQGVALLLVSHRKNQDRSVASHLQERNLCVNLRGSNYGRAPYLTAAMFRWSRSAVTCDPRSRAAARSAIPCLAANTFCARVSAFVHSATAT
jgi:hypothetical protein